MSAINGIVLADIALLVVLVVTLRALQNSRRANPDRQPTPIVTERRRPCDTTGCGMNGPIVTRYRNGDTAHVCAGCNATGTVLGWFA